jgi:hypothetical protein
MRSGNIHDRVQGPSTLDLEKAIAQAHATLCKEHKWLRRLIKVPYRTAAKSQRGYMAAKAAGYKGTPYDACLELYRQWNWKRSAAPSLFLESEALWRSLSQRTHIELLEEEATNQEALERAFSWLKKELKNRGNSPIAKRQILEYATATLALEELSPSQKQKWEDALEAA